MTSDEISGTSKKICVIDTIGYLMDVGSHLLDTKCSISIQ